MLRRAYSVLEVKAVQEDQWTVEGIASTPTPDRYQDVVEPMGAKFALPMPLLWQHDARKPVGEVTFAKPTKKGIPFRAKIRKAAEFSSETLKERALEAWESVKTGLVRGVSIGFKELEYAFLENGGIHFTEWEWLELSLVTIPANAEATITNVKSIDTELRAASGADGARSLASPGVSGIHRTRTSGRAIMTLTIEQNLANLEASRSQKKARMEEIAGQVSDENRTKNEAEREEYDGLRDDIKAIDVELKDLKDLQSIQGTAKVVDGTNSEKAGASRDTGVRVVHEKPEKGIEFARFAMCVAAAKGDARGALELAERHYPNQRRIADVLRGATQQGQSVEKFIATRMKTAVAGGTTADTTWAAPLVAYTQYSGDFVEYLRPMTLIGRFGMDGIPALRRIPFNVHIRGQTSGGSAGWVGEGKAKPVTKFDFNDTEHDWNKIAAIAVLTEDLIRFSDPSAEALVRSSLADAVIARMDTDFVDPTKSASAGVSPASITNGVAAITSSGDTADDVRADLLSLWAAAIAANLPLTDAVYITTPAIALSLSLMRNLDGQPEFPGVTIRGGTLEGVPALTSNYVPTGTFILAFASEIYLSDDGVVTLDASRETAIEMSDGPSGDATAGTGASLVSMFQTNSVALRAERFITWSKRRSTAVALLEDVGWGGVATS